MTKKEMLDMLQLLSSMESWSLAHNHRLPDYLIENLGESIEVLRREMLK